MKTSKVVEIPTYYHKLGHLQHITYFIYGSTSASDQSLLEAELAIRYDHPKILLTYYNKLIYAFQLHSSQQPDYDPIPKFPFLELKQRNTVTPEALSNSLKPSADKNTSFTNLCFLKAVKKMILFNLLASLSHNVHLFGNYAVFCCENSPYYSVAYAEPGLLANGDLVVSLVAKAQCDLFSSSIINVVSLAATYARPSDFNHAIYLIPSGIRCHLFDPIDVSSNFSTKLSASNENLLHLIQLVTGKTHLTKENGEGIRQEDKLLWVRLTPNLNHLNNQTSPISDFIHLVDNRKYILWPWLLCLIQLGRYASSSVSSGQEPSPTPNPLSLMSSLMDFKIARYNRLQLPLLKADAHPPKVEESARENVSPIPADPQDLFVEMDNVLGMTPGMMDNLDFLKHSNVAEANGVLANEANPQQQQPNATDDLSQNNKESSRHPHDSEGDADMDELFGDGDSSSATNSPEVTKSVHMEVDNNMPQSSTQNEGPQFANSSASQDQLSSKSIEIGESLDPSMHSKTTSENARPVLPSSVFDISRDEMVIRSPSVPAYCDPGAPLPITNPTPMISAAPTFPWNSASDDSSGIDDRLNLSQNKISKSVFSPIAFNPLIKNSLDTKYGKGGKFYVEKLSKDKVKVPDKTQRATSVNGLSPFRGSRALRSSFYKRDRVNSDGDMPSSDAVMTGSSEESDADEQNSPRQQDDVFNMSFQPQPPLDNFIHPADACSSGGGGGADIEMTDDRTQDIAQKSRKVLPLIPQPKASNYGNDVIENGVVLPESIESAEQNMTFETPNIFASRNGQLKVSSPFLMGEFRSLPAPNEGEIGTSRVTTTLGNSPLSQLQPSPERMAAFTGDISESPDKQGYESRLVDISKKTAESSNYLPLILRSVNVSSIPRKFLLSYPSSAAHASFEIHDVDKEEEWDLAPSAEMTVKQSNLDVLLDCLVPNLIYDMGLNRYKTPLRFSIAGKSDLECRELSQAADDQRTGILNAALSGVFKKAFPSSYQIPLAELLIDYSYNNEEEEEESSDQFLKKISNLNGDVNEEGKRGSEGGGGGGVEEEDGKQSPQKRFHATTWNCLTAESTGLASNLVPDRYSKAIRDIVSRTTFDEAKLFNIPVPKAKVLKNDKNINLNCNGLAFWNLLGLKQVGLAKNFRVILVGPKFPAKKADIAATFLENLIQHYSLCKLGEISKVELSSADGSIEVKDGLLLAGGALDVDNLDFYRQVDQKLKLLVDLLRLEMIKETNSPSMRIPLLLLFVNPNMTLGSPLQISKLFRNFMKALSTQQLPTSHIFTKIIPESCFAKSKFQQFQIKTISSHTLVQMALNLYNECLDSQNLSRATKTLYSHYIPEPPSSISFKFLNQNSRDHDGRFDYFLHLAYERSVDRSWVAAAWSDQNGLVSQSKAWYCKTNATAHSNRDDAYVLSRGKTRTHDIGSICDDIWDTSAELFEELYNNHTACLRSSAGKKHLVLTRVNGIIPDDELVHWKRLTVKHKDVSLIVLSVSSTPKVLNGFETDLSANDAGLSSLPPEARQFDAASTTAESDQRVCVSSHATPLNSGLAFMCSPSTGIYLHSPQQFLNAAGGAWSPRDNAVVKGGPAGSEEFNALQNSEFILRDAAMELIGVVPKFPLPLFSSPSRLSMRGGYLLKCVANSYMAFDVNILSCSNNWNPDVLMKLLLKQYRRLTCLRTMLGLDDFHGKWMSREHAEEDGPGATDESIVPWHIAAVSKVLDYLVHIRVEDE